LDMDEGYAKEELWGVCSLRAYEQLSVQKFGEVRRRSFPTHSSPQHRVVCVVCVWSSCDDGAVTAALNDEMRYC